MFGQYEVDYVPIERSLLQVFVFGVPSQYNATNAIPNVSR
jgi:hypothetical protein